MIRGLVALALAAVVSLAVACVRTVELDPPSDTARPDAPGPGPDADLDAPPPDSVLDAGPDAL